MKYLKNLVLTSAVLLLTAADGHAFGRRHLAARRTCVSPAPVPATRYQTIPPAGVPALPPPTVMPAVGVVTLPARPVFHAVQPFGQCVGGTCGVR